MLFLTIRRFCWNSNLFYWCLLLVKNLNVLLEIYLLPLIFIISQELEDRVGKICYNPEIYYNLRIWKFCWKDTSSFWHLLFLKGWRFFFKENLWQWQLLILRILRFCWEDTLSLWHLLFLRIWRFCWKDNVSHWYLLFLKFEDSIGSMSYPTDFC